MTTNYRLSDNLPKDEAGAKILAPVNDATSQLDFALLRGIAVQSLGGLSANTVHLAVGSHTVGSKVENAAPVMLLGAAYNEAPSSVGTGNAVAARSDSLGNLYVRSASTTLSYSSASTEIHFTGSGILQSAWVQFSDVAAGDTLIIEDGTAHRMGFVATSTSQHFHEALPSMYFGTSLRTKFTFAGAGAGSITIGFVQN